MLEKYDTWSQVFDQTFEVLLTTARSSESPTSCWSNSCQEKGLIKSVMTFRLLLNSEQSQTDLRGIRRTSIQSQYHLPSCSRANCCRNFNTTRAPVLFGTNGTCCSSCQAISWGKRLKHALRAQAVKRSRTISLPDTSITKLLGEFEMAHLNEHAARTSPTWIFGK